MTRRVGLIALAVALGVSILGNVAQAAMGLYSGIDHGYLVSDMTSHARDQKAEIEALRSFSQKLAKGETPMAALRSFGEPEEEDGWLAAGALMVKMDGERLVKVCGSTRLLPDPCTEGPQ